MSSEQTARLRAARAALDANDFRTAATALAEYRASADESLAYDRNYLMLFHECDLKARRASQVVANA
jgi:hypothetical protein